MFYVGSYLLDGEAIRREVIINQHIPSPGAFPLFGGAEVGIGFSGSPTRTRALEGVAFVRGSSLRFRATLRRLVDLH